jgi:subtilisin family serine protease
MKKIQFFAFSLLLAFEVLGQSRPTSIPANWFLLDPAKDSVQGMSVEKAYEELLKGKKSVPVIVAVIDSGVDIDHEDLRDVIWTNPKEIPGNGLDDDKNGYPDDVHGWNFIGGKDGRNVNEDTYELTREYLRLRAQFGTQNENNIPKKDREAFQSFKKITDKFEKLKAKNEEKYSMFKNLYVNLQNSIDTLKSFLGTDTLTRANIAGVKSDNPTILFSKGLITNVLDNLDDSYASVDQVMTELKAAYDYYRVIVEHGYNTEFNSREIVGDDPTNPTERYYGNADVKGPDAMHGTHVAGIIAAKRNNGIGINGIADNVRIMPVRAVPNGDERDKDVANAIYYAVDNGAQIINMSFGKSFSPDKVLVDKAVQYAERKGVLLVHAAGNDGEDIDVEKNYPSRYYLNGKEASNWLEIGASSWGAGENLVGEFSNYGKKSVDLFSPGVGIYSTVPGSKYEDAQGTSMAAPAVAGVAAVLKSYFPTLSAQQLRGVILRSTRYMGELDVIEPGIKRLTKFKNLCVAGGVINCYNALLEAESSLVSKKQ